MISIPRAPSLEKPWMQMHANPNNIGHGSPWGLLPYDKNKWKCKWDKTSTSIDNSFSTPYDPFNTSTSTSKKNICI